MEKSIPYRTVARNDNLKYHGQRFTFFKPLRSRADCNNICEQWVHLTGRATVFPGWQHPRTYADLRYGILCAF